MLWTVLYYHHDKVNEHTSLSPWQHLMQSSAGKTFFNRYTTSHITIFFQSCRMVSCVLKHSAFYSNRKLIAFRAISRSAEQMMQKTTFVSHLILNFINSHLAPWLLYYETQPTKM